MQRLILQTLLLFATFILPGQNFNKEYNRITNYYPGKNYFNAVKNGFDSIYQSIDYVSKAERVTFKTALQDNKNTLQTLADEKLIMKNDLISGYLQVIANRIVNKNEILKGKKFEVMVYRSSVPNAANYGNGIVLFNLDLLSKFDREEYVAFTICHEISHEIKKHVINGIRYGYQLKNDPAMKQRFEKIKKQEYRQRTSFEAYVTEYVYKSTSKKRAAETEADSLGLVLYCNAGYKKEYALRALQLLDSVDNSHRNEKINYESHFNNGDFKFLSSWLDKVEEDNEGFGNNIVEKVKPDSLKTHPDCKIRVEKVKGLNITGGEYTGNKDVYLDVFMASRFEMLEHYSYRKELSRGLYESLQLLGAYKDNIFLKTKVEEFLVELYYAKVNHYFILVTDQPDKSLNKEYVSLLNFVNNISSATLLECAKSYFKANFDTTIKDPYIAYVFTLLKLTEKNKEEAITTIKEYESNFGQNDYLSELKIKFDVPK